MKHRKKSAAKRALGSPLKKPKKRPKKPLTPEQIAAAVREQIAPALSAIGVVARNHQFVGRIERLAATLALWGPKVNLTAHPEDPDEIVFHVFDSLIPLSLAVNAKIFRLRPGFEPDRRILDIGSGAGFPGLVIAAAINCHVTLVESRRKRASFLTSAAIEMGLRNVTVLTGRAEGLSLRDGFDLVTARAVAKQSDVFRIAAPALHLGGVLMLYLSAAQKLDAAAAAANGLIDSDVLGYELRHGKESTHRAVATWIRR